jgi:hypothetical protein
MSTTSFPPACTESLPRAVAVTGSGAARAGFTPLKLQLPTSTAASAPALTPAQFDLLRRANLASHLGLPAVASAFLSMAKLEAVQPLPAEPFRAHALPALREPILSRPAGPFTAHRAA